MKHNWEYKSFAEVVDTLTPRFKVDKSDYLPVGAVPVISQEESFISGYWNNIEDITPHTKPIVIFGDHSRVLKYVDCDFVVGADGVKILQAKDSIEPKFLYHFLRWYNVPSLGYSRHFKLIKEAPYPVPPIAVQEQIVEELDAINGLIEKNREVLRNLDALAQSLFYNTFGDPISNPKGYKISLLEQCVTPNCPISYGIVQPGDDFENGIPVVRPVDFINHRFVRVDNLKRVNPIISEPYKRTLLNGDEILMCVRGTTGMIRLADKSLNGANVTRGIVPIQVREDYSKTYIYEYLKSEKAQSYIAYFTKGTTLKQINIADLRKLPVLIPPLDLQEDFASKIEAIEAQKAKVESAIAQLQTLLDSRMDYWFN